MFDLSPAAQRSSKGTVCYLSDFERRGRRKMEVFRKNLVVMGIPRFSRLINLRGALKLGGWWILENLPL
jgi:hypothetical protein